MTLFFNASDILLSTLLNLLLANITILLCLLFLLLFIFNSFFTIHVQIENARLKLTLVILSRVPMTVANDTTEILPVVTDSQNSQKK